MKRLLLSLLLTTGCSSPPSEPIPAPAATPSPRPGPRFVQASSLNLRSAPDAGAPRVASLRINTATQVLGKQGDWRRVRLGDGREGWVPGEYLASERLALADAKRAALAATGPDALAWWQRAAAIAPDDPEALAGLAAAYRATGQEQLAAQVARAVERLADGDPVRACLPPQLLTAIDEASARLKGVASSAELHAARAAQMDLNRRLTETVEGCRAWPEYMWTGPLVAWLEARVPGSHIAVYAEGTMSVLELDLDQWRPLVQATPERDDDAFFALADGAYDNFSLAGWPKWNERTWDYGGCSLLYQGAHRRVLRLTDAVLRVGGPFLVEAQAVRAAVLDAIENDQETFPFCLVTGGDVPHEALSAEVQTILLEVELSEAERHGLRGRLEEWGSGEAPDDAGLPGAAQPPITVATWCRGEPTSAAWRQGAIEELAPAVTSPGDPLCLLPWAESPGALAPWSDAGGWVDLDLQGLATCGDGPEPPEALVRPRELLVAAQGAIRVQARTMAGNADGGGYERTGWGSWREVVDGEGLVRAPWSAVAGEADHQVELLVTVEGPGGTSSSRSLQLLWPISC